MRRDIKKMNEKEDTQGVYPKRAREPASRPRDISKEMSTGGKNE
jgi:hypothetical protein